MAGYRARQIAVGLAAAARIAVYAQDEQPAPTFRSEINYVQLPVRVLDAHGQFISNLTQSDFRILEDGKPQTISAFSAVDIPFTPADATVPATPLAGLDAVASNEVPQVDGRAYLFVLDDVHTETGDTLRVRNLMHGFIRDRLSTNDLAAISIIGGARAQNFTRNRRLLHDAVDRFFGDRDETLPIRRSTQALNTITRMAEWLGSIKGRRKALVLITPSAICQLSDDAECREPLQQALRVTMQSDVSIYVVDPVGLEGAQRRSRAENDNPTSRYVEGVNVEASNEGAARAAFLEGRTGVRGPSDGVRYLAEESGGIALVNMVDLGPGLDRIVRDNSSYYLLGYRSTNSRTDGKFRRNEVTVARTGVRVVHRNGYFAARQAPKVDSPVTAGRPAVISLLQELARSPLPVSAMPLRVAATPFLSAANKARVAIVVEMPYEGLRPVTDDGKYRLNISLSIGFYDRDGKSAGGEEPNIDLDIPLDAAPKVTRNGMRFVSRIEVPPGAYRFWVGAIQPASGLRGSVMTEIDIPDFDKHPLAVSGIAVSSTEGRRIYTARTDALLDDIFGGPPVAHREFILDSDLWLYGEIYDHRSDGGEVTSDVTIKSADGTVVYKAAFEPAPVQFGHLARIPLKEIGVGSFVATIEARSSSPKPISSTRTVAFRVK